jgi:hypothetical protein
VRIMSDVCNASRHFVLMILTCGFNNPVMRRSNLF